MPFSNVEQITPIMREVNRIRPRALLDVGCGLGIYGLLSRVQLDLYWDEQFHLKLFRDRRQDKRWQGTRIDAIEGFGDYLDYIPDWVYDDIRVEDVRTALATIANDRYDLCLALAILEHLDHSDGTAFIEHLKRIAETAIVAVPRQVGPQEVPGNPFETHRSQWRREDLEALGAERFLPHAGCWIAVFERTPRPDLPDAIPTQSPPAPDPAIPQIVAKLDQLAAGQTRILQALSLKHRLRNLWRRHPSNP